MTSQNVVSSGDLNVYDLAKLVEAEYAVIRPRVQAAPGAPELQGFYGLEKDVFFRWVWINTYTYHF